jgi:hypothetical protein
MTDRGLPLQDRIREVLWGWLGTGTTVDLVLQDLDDAGLEIVERDRPLAERRLPERRLFSFVLPDGEWLFEVHSEYDQIVIRRKHYGYGTGAQILHLVDGGRA